MIELMTALLLWGSSFTGHPMPEELPRVVTLERCQMFHIAYPGKECPPADYHQQTMALHLNGVVYLRDTWKHDNLHDVAVLLHELVHYLQLNDGVEWGPMGMPRCKLETLERPAYDAHLAFLEAAKVEDPYALMRTNELTVFFQTTCLPEGM